MTESFNLTNLFTASSPAVLGFISRLSIGGTKPDFPHIFGTGFFVHSSGIAVTNRHVVEAFSQFPIHPKTGESPLAAVLFLPGDNDQSWQMLAFDVREWIALAEFKSSESWFGQNLPDIGFVQLAVREVPVLNLASEKSYLKIGMDIATIGYPMGSAPLTALGKLNQVSPFIRHGVVSSIFPFPTSIPHGFTIDIMQQGGSSGSPIFRNNGDVVGMMSSSMLDRAYGEYQNQSISYLQNTNISIAEPSHIIQEALNYTLDPSRKRPDVTNLPTLAEIKAQYPCPDEISGLTWESWKEPIK